MEGSAADTDGLEPGVVVASIDGRSYEAATSEDFCALMTDPPPDDAAPTSITLVTAAGTSHEISAVEGFWDPLGS